MVEFWVPGIPQPQGSKKGFVTRSGKVAMVESAVKVKPWRSDVKVFAALAMGDRPPMSGPVFVRCDFVMRRPLSTPKTRVTPPAVKKPDLDKILRAILDALTGTVYLDDSAVVELVGTKRIAELNEQPGVRVVVGVR